MAAILFLSFQNFLKVRNHPEAGAVARNACTRRRAPSSGTERRSSPAGGQSSYDPHEPRRPGLRRRALVVLAAQAQAGARAATIPPGAASADRPALRLSLMPHSGDERRAFDAWIAGYNATAPSAVVSLHPQPPDAYKATLRDRLAGEPDIPDLHYWFAGARLAELAAAGLLAPLDDVWREARLDVAFGAPLQRAVSWNGRPWAVPLNYYQWGFYYRRSTFARAGLQPPATWAEYLAMGDKARAAGLAPTAVGAADTWTLAAWFDYFDLRLNGLAFHQQLADGQVPFTDPRVRRVFATWQQARERGVFLPEALALGWRDAVPFLLRERAATLLMGNFFEQTVPASMRDDIGFFPFPRLDPKMPDYEDAPVDVLMVAARGRHRDAAMGFLRWAASAPAQARLAGASGKVPTHLAAPIAGDRLTQAGADLLRGSAGLAQFFDRDAPASLALPALEVFGAFMADRVTLDVALDRLEAARRGMRRAAS
jgi:multiple sugar transport system substrate-binding protein